MYQMVILETLVLSLRRIYRQIAKEETMANRDINVGFHIKKALVFAILKNLISSHNGRYYAPTAAECNSNAEVAKQQRYY